MSHLLGPAEDEACRPPHKGPDTLCTVLVLAAVAWQRKAATAESHEVHCRPCQCNALGGLDGPFRNQLPEGTSEWVTGYAERDLPCRVKLPATSSSITLRQHHKNVQCRSMAT